MNKLSKAQRERLMLIVIGAIVLMVAVWYLLVVPKQDELRRTERDISQKQEKLSKAEGVARSAADVGANFTNKFELLQQRESGMAPERGAYEWIINTINPFIQSRKGVNIVSFSEPTISDQGLLPKFPYRWATFHISAVGYYQDFGKFFADFENSYPYFRIQNLDISGNTGPASEPEKLAFSFDIVTPVVAAAETK
ncbi:MAG TPA: type II secretion system protein GspM [Verrucomicrobiae bacterium]|jgi:membrane protein YdbS with pleckstrin-like domain|nr:type II secretion system protein GspM [Verrucomicrobiae bacterium]